MPVTGFELYVPRRLVSSRTRPPWYNRNIMRLKNLKSKKYLTYCRSGLRADYSFYAKARAALLREKKAAYDEYLKSVESDLRNDASKFWSFVNVQRKTQSSPSYLTHAGGRSSDPATICSLFADFFQSVYVPDVCINSSISIPVCEYIGIGSMRLTCDEVLRALLNLDVRKGRGPDGMPPELLKACAYELCYPLCCIFNMSLFYGVFPDRWKLSYITPIFKSGSRAVVNNYRGVAILPTLGKLFESIVCDRLSSHFRCYLSDRQHGFISKRSATTNLVEISSCVLNAVESGRQLDVIYTDFSKAFDRVSHDRLMCKLAEIGIFGSLLAWLRSYLTNRIQYVKIRNVKSREFVVSSGVPQGSHLGPLLFNLFVNDIPVLFKYSDCLMYADDLKLYKCISTVRDSIDLQRDLNSLHLWCQFNRLDLNISKCRVLSFHRRLTPVLFGYEIAGDCLERVLEMKDLGVIFDEKMTFNNHIDGIISKAYSRLGFTKRLCADFRDPYTLKSVYCALVRSILEYASIVWCPGYAIHSARIESIQKKFILYALRHLPWRRDNFILPSYEDRCFLIRLESLSGRRCNAKLIFLFDLLNGHIDAPNILSAVGFSVPLRQLRSHDLFNVPFHRTNYGFFGPLSSMVSIANRAGDRFNFNVSKHCFKRVLRGEVYE